METITESPRPVRPRKPFSKAKPRKELLAQIQRAQRLREMEGEQIHEEHVEITVAPAEQLPQQTSLQPRPRPFSKARPRKELLAQIKRAQQMRYEQQQENIPPVEPLDVHIDEHIEERFDNRTRFDKLVDRLDHEGAIAKAPHPRSALEAILNEGGREYDDSTIASLENIIHPVLDTPPNSRDVKTMTEKTAHPLSNQQNADEMGSEQMALASLSKQLRSTQSTIKDAHRGLRRISNKIEGKGPSKDDDSSIPTADVDGNAVPEIKIEPPTETVVSSSKVEKVTERESQTGARTDGRSIAVSRLKPDPKSERVPQNNNALEPGTEPVTKASPAISWKLDSNCRTICSHCGGRYVSVWQGLWVEFRDNFYTFDANNKVIITWLGWITAFFLSWLMLESVLCTTWCDNVEGPLMPFVTHYVVLAPLRPYIKPYWRFLRWMISTVFNLNYGGNVHANISGTPVIHVYNAATATARATRRVVNSAREAVDEMGSIWEDGF